MSKKQLMLGVSYLSFRYPQTSRDSYCAIMTEIGFELGFLTV